jgi:hypothetical protein
MTDEQMEKIRQQTLDAFRRSDEKGIEPSAMPREGTNRDSEIAKLMHSDLGEALARLITVILDMRDAGVRVALSPSTERLGYYDAHIKWSDGLTSVVTGAETEKGS